MGTQKNRLKEAVILSTKNKCLTWRIESNIIIIILHPKFVFVWTYACPCLQKKISKVLEVSNVTLNHTATITIAHWVFFHTFVVICWLFFKINFFKKFLPKHCQMVWIQIRTDVLSVLIWVQTVCKVYQRMSSHRVIWIAFFKSNSNQWPISIFKLLHSCISRGETAFFSDFSKPLRSNTVDR